jgi:hypothetical protein
MPDDEVTTASISRESSQPKAFPIAERFAPRRRKVLARYLPPGAVRKAVELNVAGLVM